jgi:hypothetical protein
MDCKITSRRSWKKNSFLFGADNTPLEGNCSKLDTKPMKCPMEVDSHIRGHDIRRWGGSTLSHYY